MKIYTDQQGLQFYAGQGMDGKEVGKRGDRHNFRSGIALETQNFPDAPNHDNFPSSVLRPGETLTRSIRSTHSKQTSNNQPPDNGNPAANGLRPDRNRTLQRRTSRRNDTP